MWTIYHLGWLLYDLAHLAEPHTGGSAPWAWFFVAMSVLWFTAWILPRRR